MTEKSETNAVTDKFQKALEPADGSMIAIRNGDKKVSKSVKGKGVSPGYCRKGI